MATSAFNNITGTGARPHPYSIAGSYGASHTYESHDSDTRPSSTNSPPVPATGPPSTSLRAASLAGRITSANRAKLRKPFGRLRTTRSFGCVGSSQIDDDNCQPIVYAQNINPIADVDEHDFSQSFFDGMDEVDSASQQKTPKRTRSLVDTSLRLNRSRFASIRDHLTPPPMVESPGNEKRYHYQKGSLRRALSFHNGDIGEPSPDGHTLEVAKRRAGALDTAIRVIESAPYIPASPGGINTPDRSSGSSRPSGFDDLDSVSSGSVYSLTSSPTSPVHRVLLSIEDEDEVEIPQEAPQEHERLVKHSASFDNDKPPTPPLSHPRPRMVSFSRPTPQVYPHLICQTAARQESSQQVLHRSPASPVRINVPPKATPAPRSAPLSPPLLNRNPKRAPSDSGHGPLIHATLDRPFVGGGQDKSHEPTPGPRTIVPNQPAPPPSSWRRKPLTTNGKRF